MQDGMMVASALVKAITMGTIFAIASEKGEADKSIGRGTILDRAKDGNPRKMIRRCLDGRSDVIVRYKVEVEQPLNRF